MKAVVIFGVVAVAMLVWMVEPGQAISCADVTKSVALCPPYLTGAVPQPAPGCCAGLKQLIGMASTTADKRQACTCLKQEASGFPNLKDAALAALPSKCGVSLSFPVSKDVNCDNIA